MVNKISDLDGYNEFLKGLKEKIAQAQVKDALGGITRPIGVASFDLPPAVKQALAVDEIKQHLKELDVGQKSDE